MARLPRRTTIDPAWLAHGDIGAATADEDQYFHDDEAVAPLGQIMDRLLEELPELEADAIGLVIIGGLTYREAGEHQGCDKKTVWRRVQRGLGRLADRLGTKWAEPLLRDHLASGADPVELGPKLYRAFMEDAYRHSS